MLATSSASFLAKQKLIVWKKIGEGSFSKVYLTKLMSSVDVGSNSRENSVMEITTEGKSTVSKTTGVPSNKLLATKIINKNRVSNKFVEKFLPRELDLLLKLKHPNIVQVFGIYQHSSKIYIHMEYAENGDLYSFLQKRRPPLTESQIRSWTVQIFWAFRYMHTAGVVHRDMKCENVLLTSNYNVRIADFGFARFVDLGRNPGVDTVCGTLAYSSPELLSNMRPYNPIATDVWAIGVVVFMMANCIAPFRDKQKEDIYKKQMAKDYTFRKNAIRSDLLKDLISKLLEPNMLQRIKIRDALQHLWIKNGNIRTPINVQNANHVAETKKSEMNVPLITYHSINMNKVQYKLVKYNQKVPSTFNDLFTVLEDPMDTIFA